MSTKYTFEQIQEHRSADSCWVVLYGSVYDVTKFLPDHPGGSKIILQLAGTDATEEYDPIHPPGTLEDSLPKEAKLGSFDINTLPRAEKSPQETNPTAKPPQAEHHDEHPNSLDDCLNLDDIEALATHKISRKAWAYYFSAGDDLYSKSFNNHVYRQILLRPRIFVDCTKVSTDISLLGHTLQVPFFVSPAAMARLGHPDGEHGIAQACATYGAAQIISNNASQTPEQIVADAAPGQVFGWQLYVQNDRRKSEAMLARVRALSAIRFLVLTLDAPVPGKREHDERSKAVGAQALAARGEERDANGVDVGGDGGVGRALFAGTAADLTWRSTLAWLKRHTDLPIVLKGVQTHEDAYIASCFSEQVKGIILSNHGGRALDTAPPALHTLLEIRKFCPEVLDRMEVYVDGGIRRGTDVVKALALGAKAVGLGRAPLFGNGAGGRKGVEKVFEILKAETETAMRMLGVERVEELGLQHVNARSLERDIFDGREAVDRAHWVKSKL